MHFKISKKITFIVIKRFCLIFFKRQTLFHIKNSRLRLDFKKIRTIQPAHHFIHLLRITLQLIYICFIYGTCSLQVNLHLEEMKERVFAMAFTDSVHSFQHQETGEDAIDFFVKVREDCIYLSNYLKENPEIFLSFNSVFILLSYMKSQDMAGMSMRSCHFWSSTYQEFKSRDFHKAFNKDCFQLLMIAEIYMDHFCHSCPQSSLVCVTLCYLQICLNYQLKYNETC